MAELINQNTGENLDGGIRPSVETGASQNSAVFAKVKNAARAFVVAAMPAILGSCGGAVEDGKQDTPTVSYEGPGSSAENIDWQKRHVNLSYDNKDWHFEGNYLKDFRLVVYVDGKPVSNQVISVKDGKFAVQGLAGERVGNIDVQAFDAEAPFEKAPEITILPDPKSEGMVGNPHFQSRPM